MKKYKLLYALFLLIVLYSCEKDADVKLPTITDKLVLISFISPQDSVLSATVTMTQPIYNNPNNGETVYITDATVVISSASGSVTLTYDPQLQLYSAKASSLKISEGGLYTISVSTPDGKFARASTRIPHSNNTLTCPITHDSNSLKSTLNPTWMDAAATKEYYRLEIRYYYISNQSYMTMIHHINDDENPGGTFSRKFNFAADTTHKDSAILSLSVLSTEFYTYFDRLDKTPIELDPFTEPIPMYTNVEGGVGVFAGYNQYRVKIIP
jgi:hypothetical protein